MFSISNFREEEIKLIAPCNQKRWMERLIDGRGEVVDLACLVTLAMDTGYYTYAI